MTETEFKKRLAALFDEAANDIELEQIVYLTQEALDEFFEAEGVPLEETAEDKYLDRAVWGVD